MKTIQIAKRRLLQEVDLNDGKVGWLDDHGFDTWRVHTLDDELFDQNKARYHWAVFTNRRLLRFLTRGEIEHLLYADDYFPQDDLDLLDKDSGFRTFLSKPFARQYNVVLTRAIERGLFPVVKTLFSGRRWVEPGDDDICFEGASRHIDDLVELVRSAREAAKTRKPNFAEIEGLIPVPLLQGLLNVLPPALASFQAAIVTEIRSLAISCFNDHDDPDLSKAVLGLCRRVVCRSVEIKKALDEDSKTIGEIIKRRQDAARALAAELLRNRQRSRRVWLSKAAATAGVIVILCIIGSLDSNKSGRSRGSYAKPNYPWAGNSGASYRLEEDPTGSKTSYRVTSDVSAELNRDKQVIDNEKLAAAFTESRLKSLGQEIDRNRLYLDETDESDVDQFNQKVDTYNRLLERARVQNRHVNELIDRYNAKLQQYGH